MEGLELAAGWVFGTEPPDPGERSGEAAPASPKEALEAAILPCLERPPCIVAFSGGRDSSILLAVAAGLARRAGLPSPVPVTKRFPDVPGSLEDEWQELVVRYLGLPDWERIDIGDELDLVGPVAAPLLLRHGVIWSPILYSLEPLIRAASGGSLVTGEGGDEIFGARRSSAVANLRRHPLSCVRGSRALLESLGPRILRHELRREQLAREPGIPWLRPAAYAEVVDRLVEDIVSEPLDWRKSLWFHLRQRRVTAATANARFLCRAADVRYEEPFLQPSLVRALTGTAGPLGFPDRTHALLRLFPELLPDAVYRRTTKTAFNTALFSSYSREFVARWDGSGVDPELVDPQRLAEEWRRPVVHAMASGLLQSAWLASRR